MLAAAFDRLTAVVACALVVALLGCVTLGVVTRAAGNPLIWACVLGAALNPVNAFIPQPIHTVIDALSRSSLALGLLIVGAGLRLEEMTTPKPLTLPTCALKLIAMPTIAIGIALALGLTGANLAGARVDDKTKGDAVLTSLRDPSRPPQDYGAKVHPGCL